uniref:AB hydrolase-1 domain-containing protein n=2 Tax=Arion vulgaris TaxID=1028688 RepID=A0A0B7B2E3_9EUPU
MIKTAFNAVMLWGIASVYGIQVMYDILREVFKVGFGKVFQWKVLPRPLCLDDPKLGTHGYLRLEDVRIHYVASGPEDKPLMLFIHGFPEFWYSWRNQIREFQKDYRVVAIDQRGYGDSDKPAGIDAYTIKKLLSDTKQIITALGYKSCTLVSHDWGGIVAWSFSRHHADMVDKLIVMNCPPAKIIQRLIQTDNNQFKSSWYMFFFQLPYLPELYLQHKNYEFIDVIFAGSTERKHAFSGMMENPLTQEKADAYKYMLSQPGAVTPTINYYRAGLRSPNQSLTFDMNCTMPVLLIWGNKDIALSSNVPELVEKENNPNITVRQIPDSGHFVQMDTPDIVNKIMRDWLDGQKNFAPNLTMDSG